MAAAKVYFGKDVKDLTLGEAAMLAGTVSSPSATAPHLRTEKSLIGQKNILDRMYQNGFITEEEARGAAETELDFVPPKRNYKLEAEPLFAQLVENWLNEWLMEKRSENPDASLYEGYKVYTTLDPKVQAMARKAIRNGLMALAARQAGSVRTNPGPVVRSLSEEEAKIFQDNAAKGLMETRLVPDKEPAAVVTEVRAEGENPGVTVAMGEERGFIPLESFKSFGINAKNLKTKVKVNDLIMTRLLEKDFSLTLEENDFEGQGVWIMEPSLNPDIQAALVLIENSTGKVMAMYGGRDFALNNVGNKDFNKASEAKKQPGSAFKTFVYTAAMDHGYTEASVLYDVAVVYPGENNETWSPKNYSSPPSGKAMTINDAFKNSINTIAVKVGKVVGPALVADYAAKMGVASKLEPVYSLALGASEVTLLELTKAYTTFPNKGSYVEPVFVTKILNREGETVYESVPKFHKAISPETAYIMTDMLTGVTRGGTARSVGAALGAPVGGKTGTSNDNANLWFVGFTPEYTCGVWLGRDSGQTSLGGNEQGGRAAAPIFIEFMKDFLEGKESGVFEVPGGVVREGAFVYKAGQKGQGRVDFEMGEHYVPKEGPQDLGADSQKNLDDYLVR
jgi:penicillin-binding protein 1A